MLEMITKKIIYFRTINRACKYINAIYWLYLSSSWSICISLIRWQYHNLYRLNDQECHSHMQYLFSKITKIHIKFRRSYAFLLRVLFLDIESFLSIIKDNNRWFFWEWLEFKPTETIIVWDRPNIEVNFSS